MELQERVLTFKMRQHASVFNHVCLMIGRSVVGRANVPVDSPSVLTGPLGFESVIVLNSKRFSYHLVLL